MKRAQTSIATFVVAASAFVVLLGLLMATIASLSLLAALLHSWAVGSFTWGTPFDWGILFGVRFCDHWQVLSEIA